MPCLAPCSWRETPSLALLPPYAAISRSELASQAAPEVEGALCPQRLNGDNSGTTKGG